MSLPLNFYRGIRPKILPNVQKITEARKAIMASRNPIEVIENEYKTVSTSSYSKK